MATNKNNRDASKRPQSLKTFVGQKLVIENLKVYIKSALTRGVPLDHVLLCGRGGLGKTSLAEIIANEMGARPHFFSGPTMKSPADVFDMLSEVGTRDVVFIDEIHRMKPRAQEYLYTAMEDRFLPPLKDNGRAAGSLKTELPPFTLAGATTEEGLLSGPFRSRFGIQLFLERYSDCEIIVIVQERAAVLGMGISHGGAAEIARCAHGVPRTALYLVVRAIDFAVEAGSTTITEPTARKGLQSMGYDEHGLTRIERGILKAIDDHGGPIGLDVLASVTGHNKESLRLVYEPTLLQLGLITISIQGRSLTEKGRVIAKDWEV